MNEPGSPTSEELLNEVLNYVGEEEMEYHYFYSKSLDWLNFDRFIEEEETRLLVNAAGFPQNTLYYLVFEDLNSVMAGYRKSGEPEERNPVFEQVPLGHKVKLVVIFNRAGDYYLAQQEILIKDGQPVELEPQEMAKEEITAYLQSLGKKAALSASR